MVRTSTICSAGTCRTSNGSALGAKVNGAISTPVYPSLRIVENVSANERPPNNSLQMANFMATHALRDRVVNRLRFSFHFNILRVAFHLSSHHKLRRVRRMSVE